MVSAPLLPVPRLVALKGKVFEPFAEALAGRHELFGEIKADHSSTTFLNALSP
jgi:hypothetical protein